MKPDFVRAHVHSSNHRDEILRSTVCGCFYCRRIFGPASIEDWIDIEDWKDFDDGVGTTALCPKCGIDSVIGSASGFPVTPEFLARMNRYWFGVV